MAFPQLDSTQTNTVNSNGTSHGITFGSSVSSGLLAIWVSSYNDSATVTTASGWTTLVDQNSSPGNSHGTILAKVTDGTEGSTTVTNTTSSNTQSAQTLTLYSDWGGSISDVEVSTVASGSNNSQDPPSLTPSWGSDDTTWVAVCISRRGDKTVSTYPTSYTSNQTTLTTSTGSGGAGVHFATRENATATEDPSNFTLSSGTSWMAVTIGIKPSTGGGPTASPKNLFGHPLLGPFAGPIAA